MTVRREGESDDYRLGFWSLSQYSLEIVLLGFSSFVIWLVWARTQPEGGCLVLYGSIVGMEFLFLIFLISGLD